MNSLVSKRSFDFNNWLSVVSSSREGIRCINSFVSATVECNGLNDILIISHNIYIALTSYGRIWLGGISSKSFLQQLTVCVSVLHLHGPRLQRFHRSTPDVIDHTETIDILHRLLTCSSTR